MPLNWTIMKRFTIRRRGCVWVLHVDGAQHTGPWVEVDP